MKMRYLVFLISVLLLSGSCNQNMERVNTGERLEDSKKPALDPNATPLAHKGEAPPAPGGEAAKEGESDMEKIPPFVKAYFMQKWVAALYSPPENKNPNPNWMSPLKDPANGRVWCTDCHKRTDLDFSRLQSVPRTPMVDALEKDKEFMVGLMKKWVARLNSDEFDAKAKLKGTVTCLTCHATNPAAE